MLIRELTENDMPSLALLYEQFWNEPSDIDKMWETFVKLQHDEAYILLGAIEEDSLAGSIMGIVCNELYGECRPFLVVENMIVDKKFRQHGIGKALFTEMESRAKSRGCAQVILVTDTDRLAACAFYESLGFHPTANKGYKKKL